MTRNLLALAAVAGAGLIGAQSNYRADAADQEIHADTVRSGDPVFHSTADDRKSVSITVYNQNFGLVREVRDVTFTRGIASLEYRDVAQHVQPETVHIRSLGGGLGILEQNYQFDLLNPQKLLEKYVGRSVTVYRTNPQTGADEPVSAEVLSVNGGPILKIGDEITFNYPGRFSFPEIPDNLIARPTLVWRLDSQRPRHELEVSYLTNNMNWKADYVFVVDDQDRRGDLTGWVTLTNQSGTTFTNAQLKLVAGDVQRVSANDVGKMRDEMRRLAAAEASAPQFSQESFFEYHLYTLGRPATLRENEQKQVTLLESSGIGVEKKLVFYGAQHYYRGQYGEVVSNQKVGVYLDFQNTEKNRLGMPLPRGVVRVYKADASGAQQFIGEDRIDHTPRDERVRIRMGEAFDVVGDRRQQEFRIISGCVSESQWEITLRNHKKERARIDVIEPVGGDWEILSSSHPYTKLDAHTFAYHVDVAPDGEAKIRYRVRVRWC
ncbi:MAG TPA: DUF4139 domain-containing protein [Longimicrobiales bacterium]|nr:DUF4139 domain-containing protein [Longimicrobiales bacterium]